MEIDIQVTVRSVQNQEILFTFDTPVTVRSRSLYGRIYEDNFLMRYLVLMKLDCFTNQCRTKQNNCHGTSKYEWNREKEIARYWKVTKTKMF